MIAVTGSLLFGPAFAQVDEGIGNAGTCGQAKSVQDPLIDEAERKQINIRRVEIRGNTSIRHREFVKRLRQLNEGDIFTRLWRRA